MRKASSRLIAFVLGGCVLSSVLSAASDEVLVRERIRGMVEGVRDVPLPVVIKALSGHTVVPWREQQRDALERIARAVRDSINRGGITSARINEAGNVVENHVSAALVAHGFTAHRPVAPSGRARAAGYPDLEAVAGDDAFGTDDSLTYTSTAGGTYYVVVDNYDTVINSDPTFALTVTIQ